MPETKCGFSDSADGKTKGAEALTFHGPTLFVDIGFDVEYKPGIGATPKPSVSGIWALVDTGAGESCIDSKLAAELNLPIVDRVTIAGSNGAHEVNMHLAQIHVPSLNRTILGAFAAVDLAAGGQKHRALIGRTFLMHFTMIYSGSTGDVKLFS
jgi:predicted aspartyl protease